MRLAATALMFLLAAGPAAAQTQMELNQQAAAAYDAADTALNDVYRTLRGRLSGPAANLLRYSQRDWISFRDSECQFLASGVDGGSAYPMIRTNCLEELTRERTRQLTQVLDCEEGDLSCPR